MNMDKTFQMAGRISEKIAELDMLLRERYYTEFIEIMIEIEERENKLQHDDIKDDSFPF